MGDSTARRQYATWFAVIVAPNEHDLPLTMLTSPRVIDVNKHQITERAEEGYTLSRRNYNGKRCDLIKATCLHDVVESFIDKLHKYFYSQVIFALGPWEYDPNHFQCYSQERGRRNSTEAIMTKLIELVDEYPDTKFIWRTWAGPADDKGRGVGWKHTQTHNHFMKTLIHNFQKERYEAHDPKWTHISYIDYGHVMSPRAFPMNQRIMGDLNNHFGYEARATFIQMWMNHMNELDRLEEYKLPPGWMLWNSTDTADDCYHGGGSDMYCLSRQELDAEYKNWLTISVPPKNMSRAEREQYERARVDYCSNCTSSSGHDCGYRLVWFQGKYKLDEVAALLAVVGDPKCNKSSIVVD